MGVTTHTDDGNNGNLFSKQLSLVCAVYHNSYLPCLIWTVCFAPFWPHVLNFWKRRDEPNILFLKYEDLKKVSEIYFTFF
jgi:hypothetical protein